MPISTSTTQPNRISFFRGDSHSIEVTVKKRDLTDPTGKKLVVVDLSPGLTCVLTLKTRATDTTVLVSRVGYVTNPPGTDGKLKFDFVPGDTAGIKPGLYPYDVQVTFTSGLRYTVLKDLFELKEDVTT